jgi:hypothetical protein
MLQMHRCCKCTNAANAPMLQMHQCCKFAYDTRLFSRKNAKFPRRSRLFCHSANHVPGRAVTPFAFSSLNLPPQNAPTCGGLNVIYLPLVSNSYSITPTPTRDPNRNIQAANLSPKFPSPHSHSMYSKTAHCSSVGRSMNRKLSPLVTHQSSTVYGGT